MRQLLLVGAGHAHLEVLHAFARVRPRGLRAVLISPHPALLYSGMVPGIIAGHYRGEDAAIPIAPIAQAADIEFVQTRLTAVDANAATVTCADGITRRYDVLSLNTGAVGNADAILGARENGQFVRPMEDFLIEAQTRIENAGVQPLSIVVVGGGAAGFELALAAQYRLARRGHVALVADALLAGYPASVVARGREALKSRGVTLVEKECVQIDIAHVVLKGGARLRCDAAWITNGAAAPTWLAASGLALDGHGFVATGATLQSRSHPNVFAVGDVASRTDSPHPKSGVHAVRAGPALALNLRRALAGESPLQRHAPPARTLNLLSCGSRDAIACWGNWSAQGAWVWRWKDRIDRRFVARRH